MAEESHPPARYVKLTRDQEAPADDILPGELNQPVHVPQVLLPLIPSQIRFSIHSPDQLPNTLI
jgi:hypothetical protein